jgi:hypothetical protein
VSAQLARHLQLENPIAALNILLYQTGGITGFVMLIQTLTDFYESWKKMDLFAYFNAIISILTGISHSMMAL